jgi:hypothetical protein
LFVRFLDWLEEIKGFPIFVVQKNSPVSISE